VANTVPVGITSRFKDPFSGFSHAAGSVLAVVGTVVLGLVAKSGVAFAAIVYGLSLTALYAASATYHLVRGTDALGRLLRRFDHCAVFLLIAGTYTPTIWVSLEGFTRTWMLAAVWGVAAVGIAMRIFWLGAPRWLYLGVYLAMGWMGFLEAKAFYRGMPGAALAMIAAGGLTYTVGAVIYGLKRPNPLPGRFGFHEIWHLFVLLASAFHFAAVYLLVAAP